MKIKIEEKRELVAETLLTARIQKGYSLDELGQIVGFKGNTIKRIEQGRFSPNTDQLFAICEALGVKIKINDTEI